MVETTSRTQAHPAQPSRRLAAIMFTDLVGYSALAHRDEVLAIELLELHRSWVREILPRHGGLEIETVGDAFLIEFAGALAAVECAVAIQRRFAEHNAAAPEGRRMELRVGIHLGDVEHKEGKVMGDGVNIASRIHGLAKPGGICVSEDVHRAVRNRPAFQFTSLGSPPLKNIATALELFELAPSLSLAPPALVSVARLPATGPRVWLAGAAVAAVVAAGALGVWWGMRAPADGIPSIAVLPFDNLSADPDSAFFTDGLHDTVIGHLSRVSGLKVISRTSVMSYRGQHSNLREIARELGVTNILEGSVQRAGGRLRVAAQLIDTSTDAHLWSTEYDRDLKDVFAVQADIAERVAEAVHARLTPQEEASIQSVPTRNQAAYDLYLRAVLVARMAAPDPAQVREAIGWLDEAVALDPAFARAWANLAMLNDSLYWYGEDTSEERRRLVGENAAQALKLDPGLAEAHIAKALFLYHGSRNYDAALQELQVAGGIAPGNAKVDLWMATIYRRQGRWNEAMARLARAVGLDPLNPFILNEYAITLQMLRRYDEAHAAYARLQRLEPDNPFGAVNAGFSAFLGNGDLAPLDRALQALADLPDPNCQIAQVRNGVALAQRRYDEAVAALAGCKLALLSAGDGEQVPRDYFIVLAHWLAGGRRPIAEAAKVRAQLDRMLAARPDQASVHMRLAATLAMLGDKQQSLQETDRALALLPLSLDAVSGATMIEAASQVHAAAGERERALDEVEQALSLPNGIHPQALKIDPSFDSLRQEPRFQKLLAEHLPKSSG